MQTAFNPESETSRFSNVSGTNTKVRYHSTVSEYSLEEYRKLQAEISNTE
jgi:hypothetical protein